MSAPLTILFFKADEPVWPPLDAKRLAEARGWMAIIEEKADRCDVLRHGALVARYRRRADRWVQTILIGGQVDDQNSAD